MLAETEQAIKATGGAANVSAKEVSGLADALSKKTGIDDEAIQTGENLLLTFKGIRNETGKGNDIFNQATAAVLDLSKQFGGIEGSAVQVGKALNDPIAGITALGRAGVTFTDQQKEQIKALVETGDVLGAQKIILGEINAQVGGQAAAQATAADRLKVVWGNLREELGARLLPIVDKVSTFLADRLPGALDKTGSVLGPVVRSVKSAIDGIVGGFQNPDATFGPGFDRTEKFFIQFGQTVNRVVAAVRDAIQFLIAGFKDPAALQAPRTLLDVFFVVGAGIKLAIDKIKDVVAGLFAFIVKGDFTGAFARAFHVEEDSPIVDLLFRVREAFFQLVAFVKDNVQPILLAVGAAFLIAAGPVVAIGTALVLLYARFQVVRDVIGFVVEAYGKYVSFLFDTVIPAIGSFVGYLTEQFSHLADFVRENWAGIQEAISHVVAAVQAVIETFVAVVQAVWRAWGDEILNIASIVWDQIRNVIDTVVGIIGGLIRAGLAIINGDWGAAWDAIKDVLATAWDFIKETAINGLRLLREVIEGAISGIVEFFGGVPGRIVDTLESLVGFLADVGERAVRAMANAIGDAIHWVLDKAGDLVSKVKDKLTFWDSPPEAFGLHVGQRLVRGMAQGLSETAQAEAAAAKLVESIKRQFGGAGDQNPGAALGAGLAGAAKRYFDYALESGDWMNDAITEVAESERAGLKALAQRAIAQKQAAVNSGSTPRSSVDPYYLRTDQGFRPAVSGPLIGQLVINAPSGDAPAIGAAVKQAVTQLVADGTVGRAMSKRSQTFATR